MSDNHVRTEEIGPMRRIVKVDGSVVPFDRTKLVRSMRAAGASEATSEEIAGMVESGTERSSSQKIRQLVMRELGARDLESAKRYDATRRLVAKLAIEVESGVARLPEGTMLSMRLDQGEAFQLRNDGHARTVRAELNERTVIGKNEVRLNAEDMEGLEVEDGQRIILVRQPPVLAPERGRTGGATEKGAQNPSRSHQKQELGTTLRGGRPQGGGRPPNRGSDDHIGSRTSHRADTTPNHR
jgi:hypothetical protein